MVIDLDKCNKCQACNVDDQDRDVRRSLSLVPCVKACREENNVYYSDRPEDIPYNAHWLRRVGVEQKIGSKTIEKSVILLCNHCDHPPCAQVCPVQATYKRDDGIVIVDHHRCIGCRYCMIACPYNARYFNFGAENDDEKDAENDNEAWPNKDRPKLSHGVAEACTLCAHRLDVGLPPACVAACEKEGAGALSVGDLDFEGDANDPEGKVARLIADNPVKRLREDLGTEPKVYYIGL
jgi:molybdopterin-containing oxidoreductase family iron-sulfur binding subunit